MRPRINHSVEEQYKGGRGCGGGRKGGGGKGGEIKTELEKGRGGGVGGEGEKEQADMGRKRRSESQNWNGLSLHRPVFSSMRVILQRTGTLGEGCKG